jgi:hypothetical protein
MSKELKKLKFRSIKMKKTETKITERIIIKM